MTRLAGVLQDEGKLAEAESLFRDALAMHRRLHGDQHKTVVASLQSLAVFLKETGGDLNEAEQLLRDALLLCRNLPGKENAAHSAYALRELGLVLQAKGVPLVEQEKVFRESLDLLRTVRPPDPEEIGVILRDLAGVLADLGRPNEAEPLFRERLEIARHALSAGHPGIANEIAPLAVALLDQQKDAEAEPMLRECLAIREKALQPESPDYWLLANTRSMLGGALAGEGALLMDSDVAAGAAKLEEAEPLLLEGYAGLDAGLRDNASVAANIRDQRIREALERIVKLYDAWDQIAPDAGYAEKAAEWRARLDAYDETPTSGPAP
jgi:tetratricopeptide (TPR) repeat protein